MGGNAHRDGNLLYCQHGANECRYNLVESCAIQNFASTADHVSFVACTEKMLKDAPAAPANDVINGCALKEADRSLISSCYNGGRGPEAVKVFDIFGKQT